MEFQVGIMCMSGPAGLEYLDSKVIKILDPKENNRKAPLFYTLAGSRSRYGFFSTGGWGSAGLPSQGFTCPISGYLGFGV